ncbi:alpha/beta hydrolase family protein [Desertibacillus haloalkaliphilus]|uniref:alpha/beta hydrolase family protein n=1 Tax=Desertibacillus haloalkaliphilus TaxID=1328930 RepID=UPI001C2714BD|nr:prolyl oligopeptidase family serine peptidase [Desertibacillus haloalkaliphilus]MBU8905293.1 prolyl oligopeptidase family serine peptidase [Desertibacillus haloalkaliphilus]
MEAKIIEKQRVPSPHPNIRLYLITYKSGSFNVKGYLAVPDTPGEYPGLLYLRGGIKNVGMVRVARVIQFAAEGFVVLAPFYRGNKGGDGREDFAGDDRYDAFYAYECLANHPRVARDQVHVFGFSRGGVMALLTAITYSVRSVTCWGGVSDMKLTYEERVDLRKMLKRVIGGTPRKYPERYEWRTPLTEVGMINAPVCIIHGKRDEHVSIEHAYRLEAALRSEGKDVVIRFYDTFTHHFPEPSYRNITTELTKWMKKQ